MRKPQSMTFKRFGESFMEINKFLLLFLVLDASNKMEMEYLNKILLYVVPNGWANKSYLQGWYFELKTYRETCAMFDCMEVAKQFYKGVTPSKVPTWADTNRDGQVRKRNGGESASPTNP